MSPSKLLSDVRIHRTLYFVSRELSVRRGDIIYLLRQIDQNWYEGERNGSIGIFPASYVEVRISVLAHVVSHLVCIVSSYVQDIGAPLVICVHLLFLSALLCCGTFICCFSVLLFVLCCDVECLFVVSQCSYCCSVVLWNVYLLFISAPIGALLCCEMFICCLSAPIGALLCYGMFIYCFSVLLSVLCCAVQCLFVVYQCSYRCSVVLWNVYLLFFSAPIGALLCCAMFICCFSVPLSMLCCVVECLFVVFQCSYRCSVVLWNVYLLFFSAPIGALLCCAMFICCFSVPLSMLCCVVKCLLVVYQCSYRCSVVECLFLSAHFSCVVGCP